ncbi:2,3-bisphosphoglycerate-independent phosphoglycerate mutase [Lachnospiraceae bacterium PF1-21]|uniref:cofactor-independent phosphoglycerate mutase n=1 Tax=Ohessyouella blattaphilus TaxID=2949333 RepID=UPI003E31AA9C
MKYVVLLSDGMAGEPLAQLDGKTTMEAAAKPVMDELARDGLVGLANTVPAGMSPGSDVANLGVCGYDPKVYYTGRSPLEALSIGADLKEEDLSLRMNLVTLSSEEAAYADKRILDHSAGEISDEEAKELVSAVSAAFTRPGYIFYPGTSYRHLLVTKKREIGQLTPPHDILEKVIAEYLPADAILGDMMAKSYEILKDHPINAERREKGLNEANSLWFWGAGTKPLLTSFTEKTGKKGAMISAVDLLKGIAIGAGMDTIEVEGANGGLHTNYEGKAAAAAKTLLEDGNDFVYIHVEAPDEMGHQGLINEKVEAIENVDRRVLAPLLKELRASGEAFRIMILPDHPTPIALRTHTAAAVPFLLYDSEKPEKGPASFSEKSAKETGHVVKKGYTLIDYLLK